MSRQTSFARLTLASAALALVGLAAPAESLAQVEVTPFIGSYYAVTHLAQGTNLNTGNDFDIDQSNAFAFGGRITIPVGARLSVEGAFTYAMSGLRVTEQDLIAPGVDGGLAQDGNLIYGSLRAVLTPRRSNLYFLVGPAVVKRGGDAWNGVDSGDITDFGGVVGLGVRANVTPRFRLNVTAESYLYSFDGGGSESEFQADLLFSIGVPISLGR